VIVILYSRQLYITRIIIIIIIVIIAAAATTTVCYDGQVCRVPTLTGLKSIFWVGMCRKPKFGSDSVFKNRTVQKFDMRSDNFPIETARNQALK